MPNDAKFGLVVGVGLVIAVAVVFFRKDLPGPQTTAAEPRPRAAAADPNAAPQAISAAQGRSASAQAASLRRETGTASGKTHLIADGETLFTIAQSHYGDGSRFIDLYQANRDILTNPDQLPVGATLRLPE